MDEIKEDEIPGLDIIDERMPFDLNLDYFLSGPMSGYPEYNFTEFDNACRILRAAAITVLSPHEIDHGEPIEKRGSLPYETYMQAGLDLLDKCGGIIILPGWPQSTGARREISRAIELYMPVYFFHEPTTWKDSAELICMNRKPKP